jgi:hypothetical protein
MHEPTPIAELKRRSGEIPPLSDELNSLPPGMNIELQK